MEARLDERPRTGERVLDVLADGLSVSILRPLARGPLPTPELPGRIAPSSRTTRFNRLRELEELGVIYRQKEGGSPPLTYCMLSESGRALLPVAGRFAAWLNQANGSVPERGRVTDILTIRALSSGWGTAMLRLLAERPRSVTELAARTSPEVTYHDLRRARIALSEARLIELVRSEGRGQPYALTPLARAAVGPLASAVRWEHEHLLDREPPLSVEGETLLLMALLLVKEIPGTPSGTCILRFDDSDPVRVDVEAGLIRSVASGAESAHFPAIRAAPAAWLDALLEGRFGGLEAEGSRRLADGLAEALHRACS